MIIGKESEHIEFELTEVVPEHLPSAGDVACSVKVYCNGFAGEVGNVWFAPEDISRFLSELRYLEITRKGSAVLLNLSSQSDSSPLEFEISSEDGLGDLFVKVELQKLSYVGDSFLPTKLQAAFGLEAEYLQKTLLDFGKLFGGK
jgi:hypothetical protein